jgi:hypothetical protein
VVGKISLSGKYYIIATKSKIIKLGSNNDISWNIRNVHEIVLFNEHFIYAFSGNKIYVCDFNTSVIISELEMGYCCNAIPNMYKSKFFYYFRNDGL